MVRIKAWNRGSLDRSIADRPAGAPRRRSSAAPRGYWQRLRAALAAAVLPWLIVAATIGCVETKQLGQAPLDASAASAASATSATSATSDGPAPPSTDSTVATAVSGSDAGKRNTAGSVGRYGESEEVGSRIPVVATFSILGEWIERVAGDRARVTTLVGPGGDAHTYEPTPQAAALVADARLVFEIGLGFEGWLDKVYQASGSRATRHAVTRSVRPRFIGPPGPDAELDPHVWQSPKLADRMVEEVVDALAEADPSHAVAYRRRGDAYREELRALDVEVRELLAAVPRDRRVLVTTHDTFGYFAAEYGMEVLSVLESFSSEGGEPSAGELAAVIARIKARRVPAVFAENILDPRTTEQVAKEAGVAVVGTLYTDALGLPNSAGATYLGMMRHNARAIAEALR